MPIQSLSRPGPRPISQPRPRRPALHAPLSRVPRGGQSTFERCRPVVRASASAPEPIHAGLVEAFRPEAAAGFSGVFQFLVRRDARGEGAEFYVSVEGNEPGRAPKAELIEGRSASATVTIEATRTVFEAIKRGNVNPIDTFMKGELVLRPTVWPTRVPTPGAVQNMKAFERFFPRE